MGPETAFEDEAQSDSVALSVDVEGKGLPLEFESLEGLGCDANYTFFFCSTLCRFTGSIDSLSRRLTGLILCI